MKVVIQRVKRASVIFDNNENNIGEGMVIFLGIAKGDTEDKVKFFSNKILNLRIFENKDNKMDKSILEIKGDILIVSEFTLYGDCFSGNRPDFTLAERPDLAEKLFNSFVEELKKSGLKVEKGKFKSYMQVNICNDGPVTFVLEK